MANGVVPKRWIMLSSIGLAVGIPGGLALGAPLEVIVGAMIVTPLMLGLSGLLLGTSQWLALRGTLQHAGRWIGLTVLGFSAGFTVAVVAVEQGGALLTGTPVRLATTGTLGLLLSVCVIGIVGGTVLGIAQSFALRDFVGAASRWVSATVFGLTAGFVTGALAATAVGGIDSVPGLVLFLVVTGLVYSAVTNRVFRHLPTPV